MIPASFVEINARSVIVPCPSSPPAFKSTGWEGEEICGTVLVGASEVGVGVVSDDMVVGEVVARVRQGRER
jgi:hypothetical protein